MISRALHRTALLALATTLACPALVHPLYAVRCTNASWQGNYGFLVTGTAIDGPIAIVGQITADGNGNITGLETVSENGSIFDTLTVTGAYKISSKCSGTATITPQGGTTANYNLAVLPSAKVHIVGADNGTVQSGFALPQGISSCSSSGVKGNYSLAENGTFVGQGPTAYGGLLNIQGNGTLTGTRWGSVNGTISSGDAVSGVYKIDKRCFGGAVLSINHGSPTHFNLVVVNGEHMVLFVQTDAGTVLSGSWEQ
jgi:hypothetical protein